MPDFGIHDGVTVEDSGNNDIDEISGGVRFVGDDDGITRLTFSFADANSLFDSDFYNGEEVYHTSGLEALTEEQQELARGYLDFIERVTNIDFTEVVEDGTAENIGTIRFAATDVSFPGGLADAWANLPPEAEGSSGEGDIWLYGTGGNHTTIGGRVIAHELGHALGLVHEHDLRDELSGIEYTFQRVDTVTSSVNDGYVLVSDAPSTYMWLDIQALQHLYGADTTDTVGNDTYVLDTAEYNFLTIWDGGGTDTISITSSGAVEDVNINLTPGTWIDVGTEVQYVRQTNSSDTLTETQTVYIAPDTTIENISSGAGDDVLVGNDAANTIRGNDGDDYISGGAGNDRVVGGQGHDTVYGGAGNDAMWAGGTETGNDHLFGGSGTDTLGGNGGNDVLVGGTGADVIFGGDGDDLVSTGDYDDANNNNRFDAGEAVSADTEANVAWLGAGEDTVYGDDGDERIGGGADSDVIYGGGGSDTIYAGGGDDSHDTIDGEEGDDLIFSGKGNDNSSGGAGADVVYGGSGNDTVNGDGGNDTIWGGAGNDIMNGGTGNDRITSGTGNDTLTGGVGDDVFVFNTTSGQDRITDFDEADDMLDLVAFEFGSIDDALATAVQSGSSVVFTIDDTVITLQNTSLGDLDADNLLI